MLLNWARKVLPAALCGVLLAGASAAQTLEQQDYPPGPGAQEAAAERTAQPAPNAALQDNTASEPIVEPAQVKRHFESRFPGVDVVSVRATPFEGLYEVQVGNDLVYSDAQVRFVMQGALIDAIDRVDLTAQRQYSLNQVNFDELPLDKAIKQMAAG